MEIADRLYVTNGDDWREWLKSNYDKKKEVWLIYYKKHTGKPRIPYGEAVEEALCFGWIDSIVKKIDDEKFTQKFTPRKSKSKWSEANKERARRMIRRGKMTEAGFARIREAKNRGEWFKTPMRKELTIPTDLRMALGANDKAKNNFDNLANTYKRHYIGWISSAKKEKTRKRRLEEAIRLLEQNEKLGMK